MTRYSKEFQAALMELPELPDGPEKDRLEREHLLYSSLYPLCEHGIMYPTYCAKCVGDVNS